MGLKLFAIPLLFIVFTLLYHNIRKDTFSNYTRWLALLRLKHLLYLVWLRGISIPKPIFIGSIKLFNKILERFST